MTTTKTSISNKDNKNGNVNVIDIDIDLPSPPKRKKRTGKSKATKDKEKKAEIEELLKVIDQERGRTLLERQIITDRIGYVPPIAIPSMPEPVRNLREMEENLRQYALQLADVQDRLVAFYQDRGATGQDVEELMAEIDEQFPGHQLPGMPGGEPPPPEGGQAEGGQPPLERGGGVTIGGMPGGQPPPIRERVLAPQGDPNRPYTEYQGRQPDDTAWQEEVARQQQIVAVQGKPIKDDEPSGPVDPEGRPLDPEGRPIHSFNDQLHRLTRQLETVLNKRGRMPINRIRGLSQDPTRNLGISDLPTQQLQEQLGDIDNRENDLTDTLKAFQRLFDTATGQDENTVRLMIAGNISAPLDRYAPSIELLRDIQEYAKQIEEEMINRGETVDDPTQRPDTGTMGGRYPGRDRTPLRDRPGPPLGTISEEPTDYDPDEDDPEFTDPQRPDRGLGPMTGGDPPPIQLPVELPTETLSRGTDPQTPTPPVPPLPEYPSIKTVETLNEFRNKIEEFFDDNIEALSHPGNQIAFEKLEELTLRSISELESMGQEFVRPEGSTLPRHTRAELKEMDTRTLEQEWDQVADHLENYGQVVAGRADQFEMSDSNRQLLEGYMDDIRTELELRERQQEGGTSLEEEMGGGRGHGAEEYPREQWTGYSSSKQEINIPNPNLPTQGEIEFMNEPQLERQWNRLLQYQTDWGMELSLEDGRKVGATLRSIDDQLEVIREDPNRYDRDEREPQPIPDQYLPRKPSRDNEIASLKIQLEGLGFPSYIMEEPIVDTSIERMLRIGIRPRNIWEGYTYFLNMEREREPRFNINQGNMAKLAQFYNRAIPDASTANEFNQRLDRSWSQLESSTGRRPVLVPPTPPEATPPEEPLRETDPAFMGASHIPAPSPDEMAGGERLIYEGVRDMFEDPANLPYDPRDTRGQLPQTGMP